MYVISFLYLEWVFSRISHNNKGEKGVSLGVCLTCSVLAGCVIFLFDHFVQFQSLGKVKNETVLKCL